MKAIETVYNNYRFRSRLEARHAVFFDALDIKYEYEKEGYHLGDTRYLPDFWLPMQECWVEIKGQKPTIDERYKAFALAEITRYPVFIFVGAIEPEQQMIRFKPTDWYLTGVDPISPCLEEGTCAQKFANCKDCLYETHIPITRDIILAWLPTEKKYGRDILRITTVDGFVMMEDPQKYNQLEGMPVFKSLPSPLSKCTGQLEDAMAEHPHWLYWLDGNEVPPEEGWLWFECEECCKLAIERPDVTHYCGLMCECSCSSDTWPRSDTSRLLDAYAAARQARFEFGR